MVSGASSVHPWKLRARRLQSPCRSVVRPGIDRINVCKTTEHNHLTSDTVGGNCRGATCKRNCWWKQLRPVGTVPLPHFELIELPSESSKIIDPSIWIWEQHWTGNRRRLMRRCRFCPPWRFFVPQTRIPPVVFLHPTSP